MKFRKKSTYGRYKARVRRAEGRRTSRAARILRTVRHGMRNHLSLAVGAATLGLSALFVIFWNLSGLLLAGQWPSNLTDVAIGRTTGRALATTTALSLVAGFGGAIALVVTYRKQRRLEETHFQERMAAAAQQLGDSNPTIQASGIYALTALADQSEGAMRQQCINVLCSYMRLPFFPRKNSNHEQAPSLIKIKQAGPAESGTLEVEETLEHRPYDAQVRETIVRVMAEHLQPSSKVSWSDNEFFFWGGTFPLGSFSGCVFRSLAAFDNTVFPLDAEFYFTDCKFEGTSSFKGATFANGARVKFDRARFEWADFRECTFRGANVTFVDACFESLKLDHSKFISGNVDFRNAAFGWRGSAKEVEFDGCDVSFQGASFGSSGDSASWRNPELLSFDGASFKNGQIDFTGAHFYSMPPDMRKSVFAGAEIIFGIPGTARVRPLFPEEGPVPREITLMGWPEGPFSANVSSREE